MSGKIPRHIAIIMDGNGRWAKDHGKSRLEGHSAGASIIEDVVDACKARGVEYLTLYAFSSENWNRPGNEVKALMKLLNEYVLAKKSSMIQKNVCFNVIGDVANLPAELIQGLTSTMSATKECSDIVLSVALSYGSRQEITRAINKILESGKKEISVDDIIKNLDTNNMPDPDLLIRTGGEFRISNFLLWQLAYSELYFTDTYWPDFDEKELDKAIDEYALRERRFGKISEQI